MTTQPKIRQPYSMIIQLVLNNSQMEMLGSWLVLILIASVNEIKGLADVSNNFAAQAMDGLPSESHQS